MEFREILNRLAMEWATNTPGGQAQLAVAKREVAQYEGYCGQRPYTLRVVRQQGAKPYDDEQAREAEDMLCESQYRRYMEEISSLTVQTVRLEADIEMAGLLEIATVTTNTNPALVSRYGPVKRVSIKMAKEELKVLRDRVVEAFQSLLAARDAARRAREWETKYPIPPKVIDFIIPEDDGSEEYKAYLKALDTADEFRRDLVQHDAKRVKGEGDAGVPAPAPAAAAAAVVAGAAAEA